MEIHLVPAFGDQLALDDQEGRPLQYPLLITSGEAEMIAKMGHGNSPANRDPVTLGENILNVDFEIRESSAEGTVDGLEGFGPYKNRVRVREAVGLALRVKHFVDRCFVLLVPDFLKPAPVSYTHLDVYKRQDRYPFLVKVDGKLAGLVLVKRGSEVSGNRAVWDMAEFFVLRGCRRRGIGTQVAHEVWKQFPGPWEVRVMKSNVSAHDFWTRAISAFTGEAIHPVYAEKGGWKIYTFESKRR